MSAPILATKLYIPPTRPELVPRPRLIERLNEGLHRKLTLISAPVGYGKTTMLSEWIPQSERCVTWVSLDDGDNDPVRFWAHFIAALQMLDEEIGRNTLAVMQTPLLPPMEAILTSLLNEIAAFPDDFALVLDDYHMIDAKPIDEALTYLLDHLPPQMHLVIATREDPNLPLARYRARDQLTELRAADLRFTPSESADFLNQTMSLDLSKEDIASLESRTEGWIAGLQLAALSMRGREDAPGFIRAFAGINQYIVEYLVEEVLKRQSERVRSFLIQTSILDRLNGPLCDAVTGQSGGKAQLEALQRGNFFLVPLDDSRHWYRYHHLFADVLRMHLMTEQPDQVPVLHRRASEWYEQNDLVADAIRHSLVGEDFERAADLVELTMPAMRRSRQDAMLFGWLKALPAELLRYRPVLSVEQAHALLSIGELEGVENLLRDAERWLDTATDKSDQSEASSAKASPESFLQGRFAVDSPQDKFDRREIVVDKEEFRRLPGAIAIARTGLSLARGDISGAMISAQRALDVAPEDDHVTRGGAAGFLGLAHWTSGDLEEAHRTFADGMASLQKAGNISDAINGAATLAAIRIAQGRLHDAMSTYERALQLAMKRGTPALRGTADMYVGMSELECEHNNLNTATEHLSKSKEMGEHTGFPQNRYRWRVAMARIREAQGDLDGALNLLDEAERLYMSDFSPNAYPIAALKTRVWVMQERLGEAFNWTREQGLSTTDDLSYLREFEHITLARILIAKCKNDRTESAILEVIGFLERLLKAADEGGRMGSVVEILVLQALANQMQEEIPTALIPLERALKLAEPENYMRMFLAEGSNMAELIREVDARGIVPNYTRKLLSAIDVDEQGMEVEPLLSASPASSSLMDPLSQRELEVLRLFRTDLSGPEIANQLVIALSTVRTHTESIYRKLNVNNRRAAVKRANELSLI